MPRTPPPAATAAAAAAAASTAHPDTLGKRAVEVVEVHHLRFTIVSVPGSEF